MGKRGLGGLELGSLTVDGDDVDVREGVSTLATATETWRSLFFRLFLFISCSSKPFAKSPGFEDEEDEESRLFGLGACCAVLRLGSSRTGGGLNA